VASEERNEFGAAADDMLDLVKAAGYIDFVGFCDRFDRVAAKGGAAVPLAMFLMAKLAAHMMQQVAERSGLTPEQTLEGAAQYVKDWPNENIS
jgi:hypothetical protein